MAENKNIVVYLKQYNANKNVKKLLRKINPLLAKEDNIRIHLDALVNRYISEEEYRVIEAKMLLGKLCLELESIVPNSYATLLFYVKEENRIYHGAAPNIPLHQFDFFDEVNNKQLFHEMICGRAIESGDIVYSEIFSDPQCIHERVISEAEGFQSVWSIPFFQGDLIIGTFAMYQKTKEKPTQKQILLAKQKVSEYQYAIFQISESLTSKDA